MIREKFNEIIELFFYKTKEYYKENLVSFVIFGSCGRETPNPESDIDILIILENAPTGRIKRNQEFYENVEKNLEDKIKSYKNYGINTFISPLIRTKDEVLYGSPLYIDMLEGVKIFYDKENFFLNFLKSLREKIKKIGGEKKNGYWIYKKKVDKKEGVEI